MRSCIICTPHRINSRSIRGTENVARRESGEINTELLSENMKGKRPLWRTRRRWEGNIEIDFKEVKCEGVYWIRPYGSGHGSVLGTCEYVNESSGHIKDG